MLPDATTAPDVCVAKSFLRQAPYRLRDARVHRLHDPR